PPQISRGGAERPARGPAAGQGARPTVVALRVYRPPLPATVHAPEGRPAQVTARGVQGRVIKRAGPWRISGDWWTGAPWARGEWDVALTGGALYRIYFERPAGRWFVEGCYD